MSRSFALRQYLCLVLRQYPHPREAQRECDACSHVATLPRAGAPALERCGVATAPCPRIRQGGYDTARATRQ